MFWSIEPSSIAKHDLVAIAFYMSFENLKKITLTYLSGSLVSITPKSKHIIKITSKTFDIWLIELYENNFNGFEH